MKAAMATEHEHEYDDTLWPTTVWGKLYVGWFTVCLLMVLVGTWVVNEPIPVLGLPIVYVWCTGWGLAWLIGCTFFGLRMERERA